MVLVDWKELITKRTRDYDDETRPCDTRQVNGRVPLGEVGS